jgi:hypothetical protein
VFVLHGLHGDDSAPSGTPRRQRSRPSCPSSVTHGRTGKPSRATR